MLALKKPLPELPELEDCESDYGEQQEQERVDAPLDADQYGGVRHQERRQGVRRHVGQRQRQPQGGADGRDQVRDQVGQVQVAQAVLRKKKMSNVRFLFCTSYALKHILRKKLRKYVKIAQKLVYSKREVQ